MKYFGRKSGGARDESERLENTIANYETRFSAIGQTPPEPQQESNLLLKALDILDRPRNAVVGGIKAGMQGGDILQAAAKGFTGQQKTNVSELLPDVENPIARGALGFAGDVLADPLTYLTLGGAGVAKGAAGQGAKTLLKFAGQPVADVTPVASAIGKAVEATKLPELVGPIFSNRYIRKGAVSSAELPDVEKARDLILDTPRWVKGQQQQALDDISGKFKYFSKEASEQASGIIERGMKGGSIEGQQAAQVAQQITQETAAKDTAAGIQFDRIPNYVRHLYKDPPEKVMAVLNSYQQRMARLSPTGAFQKQRTIPTIAQAKAMGLTPIEDVRLLTSVREMEGIRLRSMEKMYGDLKMMGSNVISKADQAPAGWVSLPAKQLKDYAVHPEVARFLDRFNSVMETDEGVRTLGHMLNSVQNVWKGLVTAPNPAFHVRNAMGNVFNNFLGGVVNPKFYALAATIQRGADDVLELGGQQMTGQEVKNLFRNQGLEGYGFFYGETPMKYFKEAEQKFAPKRNIVASAALNPIQTGRRAGDAIETNAKMAHFLDKLAKGFTPKEAVESVRKYLFDYSDLTKAETKIRGIIPFYTWTRKNVPLQLEAMIKQPGKFTAMNKAVENARQVTGVTEDDTPDWMKGEMAIPVQVGPDGNKQFLMLDLPMTNLNMIGDAKNTAKNALGMLSPLAKIPIEVGTGRQIFTGAPIEKYPGARGRVGNVEMPAWSAYALKQLGPMPRAAATGM